MACHVSAFPGTRAVKHFRDSAGAQAQYCEVICKGEILLEQRAIDTWAMNARRSERELNQLVHENNGFILRCASKTCKRFITESDDEYEIALVAFCEAVQNFNPDVGGFIGFAALVIRRRLMDYFDSQRRRASEISAGSAMTWDENEQASGVVAEVQGRIVDGYFSEARSVKDEIEALGETLEQYGFSFFDLAEASPKAEKTKKCCARAVNWMLALAERVLAMRKKRSLPVAAISKALEIARKLIERHRRYIIAATEILDGDYPHLAEYLDYIKRERAL